MSGKDLRAILHKLDHKPIFEGTNLLAICIDKIGFQ